MLLTLIVLISCAKLFEPSLRNAPEFILRAQASIVFYFFVLLTMSIFPIAQNIVFSKFHVFLYFLIIFFTAASILGEYTRISGKSMIFVEM